MDETKKIAVMPTDYSPGHWQAMKEMAKEFYASGALPSHLSNAARVVMVLQAGAEMGIPPMQAVNTLYIVNGKVAMEGRAMLKKLKLGGIRVTWKESTDTKCTVVLEREGDVEYEETFTIEDAQKAKLTGKDNWTKFPKVMLRWRALAQAQRFYCPDITEGLYLVEEIADSGKGARYNDEGVITVESASPAADQLLEDIKNCPDRKTYMGDLIPKIKEIGSKLSYGERSAITKAAELRLGEFAQQEAATKGKKDNDATKEALAEAETNDAEGKGTDAPEEEKEASEDDSDRVVTTDADLDAVIAKIRSSKKQSQIADYLSGTVNAMPFSKEQRKEIRKWVSNKIAQINGSIPDEDDMKTLFGN